MRGSDGGWDGGRDGGRERKGGRREGKSVRTELVPGDACTIRKKAMQLHVYLTQCVDQMVLESQLPHKIVSILFKLATVNKRLTILWGI